MIPKVSIIIPCYNQGEYIQDAIDSIIAQTYTNWEMIIIDDGSTEIETINKINELTSEGYRTIRINNSGVSAARNIAANTASGEFLLFLDGDDKIDNNYLSDAMSIFSSQPALDYVYCDIQTFGHKSEYRVMSELSLNSVLLNAPTHVSGIMKKYIWEDVKGFDVEFVNGWEDWDFLIRIIAKGVKGFRIPQPYLFYRIISTSRDINANKFHYKQLEQLIFKKNISLYLKIFDTPISLLREYKIQDLQIQDLKKSKINIYNTLSYRLGAFILAPIKLISKLFFKK